MNLKKAAMFGLDARIALAIFGALSVISGAALYSAIQQSKVVALVTALSEVEKAAEAYLLDVGAMPKLTGAKYDIQELVEDINTATGWNGPYLSYEASSSSGLENPPYTSLQIRQYASTDFGGTQSVDQVSPTVCSATECFLYVVQYGLDASFADAVDEYIDGTANRKTGNVRVSVDSGGDAAVFIKRFSVLNL
tara:strand:+ start:1657 stop:2238 length:582 start_codon:yes stop_codon:yes gene_type:complete